jgi:hypothetical protein
VILGRRRTRDRVRDVEGSFVLPDALPFLLDVVGLVSRCHLKESSETKKPLRGEAVGSRRGLAACFSLN